MKPVVIAALVAGALAGAGLVALVSRPAGRASPDATPPGEASPSPTPTPTPTPSPSPTPYCDEEEFVVVLERAARASNRSLREANQYARGGAPPPKRILRMLADARADLEELRSWNLAAAAARLLEAVDRGLELQSKLVRAGRKDASIGTYNRKVQRANAVLKKIRRLAKRVLYTGTTPICLD